MSEPKLITPLLSDHIMGEPISDHHGVCCCPAMQKDSEEKYIVKIISIPASSLQLDALLLSGAYHTPEAALRYFKELADETVEEAKLLQKLSRLEGFCGYDGWQIEPMEDSSGYDVYLISPYGNTLERFLRRNPMTHLGAVNLGLDLCAALSVCRRNGHLYVDLKPENIFISDSKGYLIGDLGFVSLRSLQYTSLPDKYRNFYTAPEIKDAYSSLNSTLDIYAVGLILYQIYNGGELPMAGEPILPPSYADYEMAEIILKACAENPEDRWQDPQEMAQALVSYMQRNTVNDNPIIPVQVVDPLPESPAEEEPTDDSQLSEEENLITNGENITSSIDEPQIGKYLSVEADTEEIDQIDTSVEESIEITNDLDSPIVDPSETDLTGDVAVDEETMTLPPAEEFLEECESEDLTQMEQIAIEGFLFDDDLEDEIEELSDAVVSDEVNKMLAQADELISHKTPDPVIAPEAIEIPMPDPILPEPEPTNEPETLEPESEDSESASSEEVVDESASEPDADPVELVLEESPRPRRKKLGCLIGALMTVLIVLLLGLGGKYYYEHNYLQNIAAITLNGAQDYLTVTLDTQIDNSLLQITCTDTYGNKLIQNVVNNQASFTSLPSGVTYKINVVISGHHRLTGMTTATYTTATQTNIMGFTATAGDTDGSVILNFSVQGPDSKEGWLIKYSSDDGTEKTAACSGHMAIITGLEVGKTYNFHLVPKEPLYVVSGDTVDFTATAVIYAQNLTIHGFNNGELYATWELPEGASVDNWIVRCYNSTGFDATFTVTAPSIRIPDLDISQGYTLDVKAGGMIVGQWATISPNSITFKDILIDHSDPQRLVITWPYEGTVPEGGWQLRYSVDGSEPVIIPCSKNTCTIDQLVPGGHYSFDFILPTDISVFGGTAECTVADVQMFSGYDVSAEDMVISMCKKPEIDNWTHEDVAEDAYTNQFLIGEKAAFVIYLNAEYVTSPDNIKILYIIRNQEGNLVSLDTYTQTWTNLWYKGYCELDLPNTPSAPGSYTVQIYFNGSYITIDPIDFTVA